jgi:peptide deformylase
MSEIVTPADQERFPLLEMASQECQFPLTETDESIITKMDDLLNELDSEAAGIAAIQIGYPKRIFMIRDNTIMENRVFINPVIVSQSRSIKRDGEGCLSLPHMGVTVKRPKTVTLSYRLLDGTQTEETFSGFGARVVCHEMDHLNGVTIAHHLENSMMSRVTTTSFGMKITPQKTKAINRRRARNRRAKKARRLNRG